MRAFIHFHLKLLKTDRHEQSKGEKRKRTLYTCVCRFLCNHTRAEREKEREHSYKHTRTERENAQKISRIPFQPVITVVHTYLSSVDEDNHLQNVKVHTGYFFYFILTCQCRSDVYEETRGNNSMTANRWFVTDITGL